MLVECCKVSPRLYGKKLYLRSNRPQGTRIGLQYYVVHRSVHMEYAGIIFCGVRTYVYNRRLPVRGILMPVRIRRICLLLEKDKKASQAMHHSQRTVLGSLAGCHVIDDERLQSATT